VSVVEREVHARALGACASCIAGYHKNNDPLMQLYARGRRDIALLIFDSPDARKELADCIRRIYRTGAEK
jgi:hypothetical protein